MGSANLIARWRSVKGSVNVRSVAEDWEDKEGRGGRCSWAMADGVGRGRVEASSEGLPDGSWKLRRKPVRVLLYQRLLSAERRLAHRPAFGSPNETPATSWPSEAMRSAF